jgi:ELWxxDGT repeat protein
MMQGLDNGDGGGTAQNGVLESGEVDYTTTYCSKYVIGQVADIYSGGSSSNPGYNMEILVGDTLYFDATDGSSGIELWAHDTSNASTWRVADIRSGAGHSNPGLYMEILVGDTLYFDANDGSSGNELWAMDIEHSITYD